MAESDAFSSAWRVPPTEYLKRRPPLYALPSKPYSQYVVMRDGCALAVDVYLPQPTSAGVPPDRLPALVMFTCYYRRFAIAGESSEGIENSPNAGRFRDFFVPRGYALVVVDVRGTGASFGTRDAFRSPREREDYAEIADWIVAQSWSNGCIGSTGISYVGAASTFLASTGHPAVKAVAPLFAVWDTYTDHFYPGGVALARLAETNNDMGKALDHDRRDLLQKFAYFRNPAFAGPQPVDDDASGDLLRAAVREHIGNFVMSDFLAEFRFRDDALPYDPSFTTASISPNGYAHGFREGVAVYSVSGWYDGAGFTNSSISRFLSLPGTRRHLLIGPWDHGARVNVSPWRESVAPRFALFGELLRFFDHYLLGLETGLDEEAPVHYYTLHEEAWRAAPDWPPGIEARKWMFGYGGQLCQHNREVSGSAASSSTTMGEDVIQADFAAGTGTCTRFERLMALDCQEYYLDWHDRQSSMPSYTGSVLDTELEIVGHPLVTLRLASSEPDAALHVYLSELTADGRCYYVTEGILRALHRAQQPCPSNYVTSWPYRDFTRAQASPLPVGQEVELNIPLFPIAWRFAKGSRIRLSIAGADVDHCVQVPHGRPPILTVRFGQEAGSALTLPVSAEY